MKGINISCSSHSSTSIYSPISMDQPSSSSSSSSSLFPVTLLGGSSGGGGGSRAIDRHNPIIADERRVSKSTPPSSSHSTPFFTPKTSPFIKTPKKTKSKSKKNSSKIKTKTEIHALKKDASQPSDLITIKSSSPPESSRYLLDDPGEEFGSGFLDRVLSDFDKLKIPFEQTEISSAAVQDEEVVVVVEPKLKTSNSTKPPLPPPSNPSSDHQVVVLRVSLHCRGCEGKVRKHISRMQGVKSFNIDFAAKKVTVVGDVTPLEVLASISKVKNAQIWTPPPPSKFMYPITHNDF